MTHPASTTPIARALGALRGVALADEQDERTALLIIADPQAFIASVAEAERAAGAQLTCVAKAGGACELSVLDDGGAR